MQSQGSAASDKLSAGASGERRRRRKPVLKELSGYKDMEEGEGAVRGLHTVLLVLCVLRLK